MSRRVSQIANVSQFPKLGRGRHENEGRRIFDLHKISATASPWDVNTIRIWRLPRSFFAAEMSPTLRRSSFHESQICIPSHQFPTRLNSFRLALRPLLSPRYISPTPSLPLPSCRRFTQQPFQPSVETKTCGCARKNGCLPLSTTTRRFLEIALKSSTYCRHDATSYEIIVDVLFCARCFRATRARKRKTSDRRCWRDLYYYWERGRNTGEISASVFRSPPSPLLIDYCFIRALH